ncbi:hypothetical protein BCR37DRAFT_108364 [Protomyces lactucae-debilis]|uniref:pH-response regulator protein palC n=1 Tax=Protomyces lactucae-debilis TaxID=2754530 RepID=A0A1Y2F5G4_PROLT|nr:uncharacterized protein BCR37DRAFT_108364 [Protomyces lactucae-debilis]ORY78586.1 hypothetical protein BCR37DRAFT_108364 [Protomyces lactucae-debilis]
MPAVSMTYQFTLPSCGALFFPNASGVTDAEVQQANTHRGVLRDTLKSYKRAAVKDSLSVIRVCQAYLPHLHKLHTSQQYKSMQVNWRSMFLHHRLPNKDFPRLDFPGLSYEVLFVLLTYAQALYNDAVLQGDNAHAAEQLCRAAGIFEHVADQICPMLTERVCPETYPALPSALAKLTMAAAQLHALASLNGKTSNAMLCRIAVGASDHASSAVGLLSAHPTRKVLPSDLLDQCKRLKASALAEAYVCLALDAQKQGSIGLAVGCASLAAKLGQGKTDVTMLHAELRAENDQVTFQPVPDEAEVQRQLPSGREFCKVKVYVALSEDQATTGEGLYAGEGSYY